jgi:four helix bundle protein
MQNPANLQVTAKARALAVETYRCTTAFPREERFGLTAQMRRAAVSTGSNIAEGCGREGDRELAAFLRYALGSTSELEFQIVLARDLGFANAKDLISLAKQATEVKRMLSRLIVALRPPTNPRR